MYTMTNTLQMSWILMKIKDTKTALAAAPWNMGVEELAVQNPFSNRIKIREYGVKNSHHPSNGNKWYYDIAF